MDQKNKIPDFNEEIKTAISAQELKERTTKFLKSLEWKKLETCIIKILANIINDKTTNHPFSNDFKI